MSITEQAVEEMQRAGFSARDVEQMRLILTLFFEQWNSGGAVWAMVPVLERCVCGMPLTPLTGEADEWLNCAQYGADMYQNKRCSSVFKTNHNAYDIDNKDWNGEFPYMPKKRNLDPTIEVEIG